MDSGSLPAGLVIKRVAIDALHPDDLFAHGSDGSSNSDTLRASAGDQNVTLKLVAGGTLVGKVIDAETQSECQATVLVRRRDSDEPAATTGGSGSDGAFDFEGLKPGLYDVVAKTQSGKLGSLRSVSVAAGAATKDVVVRVEPGGRVRVRYEGKAAWVLFTVVDADTVVAVDQIETGTSSVQVVPAGTLMVRVYDSGPEHPQEKRVEVAVGDEKDVVFSDGR